MRRAVFPLALLAAFAASAAFLGGFPALRDALAAYFSGFVLLAGLPLGLRLAWGVLAGRAPEGWGKFFLGAWRLYSFLGAGLAAAGAAALWYEVSVNPAELPVVTLTDGDKTVVFRAMSHVAAPEFYGRVQKEVAAAKAAGAAYLYEGIRPGKPGSMEKLQESLGLRLDAGAYEALGRVAGLAAQSSFRLTGFGTGADRNADLDADEVLAAYARAAGTGVSSPALSAAAGDPFDPEAWAAEVLGAAGPRERAFAATVARAWLSSLAKSEGAARAALGGEGGPEIMALLDARDAHAARAIADAPEKSLYVTYGALHFQGIYDALRGIDPSWTISSVRTDRPFSE